MFDADTVKTQPRNVNVKSEEVSERARRVVRRKGWVRSAILWVCCWSIHGKWEHMGELGEGHCTLVRTTASITRRFICIVVVATLEE